MPDVSVYYDRTIGGRKTVAHMDFAKALLEQAIVGAVPGLP